MQTMRSIKRRISSVKNTRKITKAMKMVAAAKLRRAQEKAENAKPFFKKTREIMLDVYLHTREGRDHPLLKEREGERHLYIVISSDRGLCGAYNNKIFDKTKETFTDGEEISIIAIGKKARDHFQLRGYNIVSDYINIDDYPDFYFAKKIAREIISLFLAGKVDRVSLIYTNFYSAISQKCEHISLLPINPSKEKVERKHVNYIYEPSHGEVLDILLPRYVNNVLYASLLEAKASEYGSRMTAMDSATDNASDLIDELTLNYNRARQSEITTEIIDIVGGAEALK